LYISKSQQNPGRGYFKCGRREEKCKYFQWCDSFPSKVTLVNRKPKENVEKELQEQNTKKQREGKNNFEQKQQPEKKKRKIVQN